MLLENVKLPAIQPFTSSYLKEDNNVLSFFHSGFTNQEVFYTRMKELQERKFHRHSLAECIDNYMADLPQSSAVKHSINKLREDGLVVIGGQQAGLLTGPLYTIHKVISIIQLAKQQEKALGHPVIPVFWIAGEDHDFLEINHVYVENDLQLHKKGYPERVLDKRMASATEFDRDTMKKWVRSIIREFGETTHTSALLTQLDEAINQTSTITKFFAHLIMNMFKEEGLLVIDAADLSLRKIEQPFFQQLLNESDRITELVHKQQALVQENGFNPMIDIASNAVNLFITIEDERILLFKTEQGYEDKSGQLVLTKEELEAVIEKSPEKISNNVVTRPMMQEWLFPSLAFVAGPGEIAYWAELKTAFEKMEMKMPPIVPRLNITIVERDISQKCAELQLELATVLEHGTREQKEKYLKSVKDETMDKYIEETEKWLEQQYEKITSEADSMHPGLSSIVSKNLSIHQQQLAFLKKKTDDHIALKNKVMLSKYDRIASSLKPGDGPQERMWNVFYFLNRYGTDFVTQLTSIEYQFDGDHKAVSI
ncbi:bacillithiol biosynthesis cysteine-adding enzyme BshC [Jeotgalibacillus marinus]|uniref:Putative cysteine ligase BshC n=1 Tax=Jeotgalibacillus marinus TaxID=86667 RepID=A0ABV3Q2E3_9BACL